MSLLIMFALLFLTLGVKLQIWQFVVIKIKTKFSIFGPQMDIISIEKECDHCKLLLL